MNPTIRIGAAHDLLALVPALAGYQPSRSLVCLAFHGARVVGVLRYDLPASRAARDQLSDAALGVLCRLFEVDGMAAIVYTGHRYRARAAAGECALLHALTERARRAGFAVRDSLRVAVDAWGSLLDAGTPPEGRPLAEIEASPLRQHAAVQQAVANVADACAALPEVPAAEIEAVRAAVAAGDIERADPLTVTESLLLEPPGVDASPADIVRLARLVEYAAIPVCRDATMLQIAFGRAFGELTLGHGLATAESAAAAGMTVGEYVERMHRREADRPVTADPPTGRVPDPGEPAAGEPAVDELGREERELLTADDRRVGIVLTELLMGEADERPDRDRVERGLEILKRAAGSATGRPRASLLCMSAWLAWAIGRGSAAWSLLSAALDADEEHGMSRLLAQLIAAGALPEWTFRRPDEQPSPPVAVQ